MYILYTFKLTSSQSQKVQMLYLLLNDSNNIIEAWKLCNVTGNMVLHDNPIASGEKCVRSPSSFDLWTTEKKFGTLNLKTSLKSIKIGETGGFSQIESFPQNAKLIQIDKDQSSGFRQSARFVA